MEPVKAIINFSTCLAVIFAIACGISSLENWMHPRVYHQTLTQISGFLRGSFCKSLTTFVNKTGIFFTCLTTIVNKPAPLIERATAFANETLGFGAVLKVLREKWYSQLYDCGALTRFVDGGFQAEVSNILAKGGWKLMLVRKDAVVSQGIILLPMKQAKCKGCYWCYSWNCPDNSASTLCAICRLRGTCNNTWPRGMTFLRPWNKYRHTEYVR